MHSKASIWWMGLDCDPWSTLNAFPKESGFHQRLHLFTRRAICFLLLSSYGRCYTPVVNTNANQHLTFFFTVYCLVVFHYSNCHTVAVIKSVQLLLLWVFAPLLSFLGPPIFWFQLSCWWVADLCRTDYWLWYGLPLFPLVLLQLVDVLVSWFIQGA